MTAPETLIPPSPDETAPLLRKPTTTSSSSSTTSSDTTPSPRLHRTLEDDVLPETSVAGRTLGWSSAYILLISRVIGSGIFATPGAIAASVGSIGLSLLLWVLGAAIAWLGLAVSLEFGCMLPRSGGLLPLYFWCLLYSFCCRGDGWPGIREPGANADQETRSTSNSPTADPDSSRRRSSPCRP